MTKRDLVAKLASNLPHLTRKQINAIVTVMLDRITDQLASGGRVELRGFGAFSIRQRRARKGRNPRTGEQVLVEAKSAVLFRPSREMLARLMAR